MEQLTNQEKVRLLIGQGMWHTYDCNGKLPSIMMTDGPHGLRKQEENMVGNNDESKPATCFPTASAMAASWDVHAIEEMATAIAEEALAEQVSIVLGCGVNIKRSPLCGRNFEYFSEDPYLAGVLATAYIKAMQKMGVGTSLKHFAGNNQETHRMTANSEIDERALREIYLPAFEMAVKEAQPTTVMVSYNRLNGEFMTENKWMITSLLRNEWGFEGAVISDWGAVSRLERAISAGVDLEMPDSNGTHEIQLLEAVADKKVTETEFERAVGNVTKLVQERAALLQTTTVNYAEHHILARKLAAESAVLLKNDGFLPLNTNRVKKVLVVGDLAVHMRFQGGGSSHITITQDTNVVRSLGDAGLEVIYVKGYRSDKDAPVWELEKEALLCAKEDIPILFFGGLTESCEGEGYDRTTLAIPTNQVRLFEKLRYVNQNIAFFSFGGSAMQLPVLEGAKAVLHMYLSGQAVGEACTDLILGKANPCGKLAETFPKKTEDIPCYQYFGNKSDDVEYRESLYVGYRYYDKYNKEVLFPFGYGLSYTQYDYSDLHILKDTYSEGKLQVFFKIKNIGSVAGKEIAQVYVENPQCNYLRPLKELRGFVKVELQPQEEREVSVELNERSFSIYDEKQKKFLMPSGSYKILVGASSRDILLSTRVNVIGENYDRDDTKKLQEYFHQTGDVFEISQGQFSLLYNKALSKLDQRGKGDFTMQDSIETLCKYSSLARLLKKYVTKEILHLNKGKTVNDPAVHMMLACALEGTLDNLVCASNKKLSRRRAEAVLMEANGDKKGAYREFYLH